MAFFEELKKGITDVSESIAKKSSEVVGLQKLKMKKSSLESDIRKDFVRLGKVYFAKMEETGVIDDEAMDCYQKIVDAQAAVEEIEAKIEKLSGEKTCKACGHKTSLGTVYCPQCGTKFEVKEETCGEEAEADSDTDIDDAPESCGCESDSAEPETDGSEGADNSDEACGCEAAEAEETAAQEEAGEAQEQDTADCGCDEDKTEGEEFKA